MSERHPIRNRTAIGPRQGNDWRCAGEEPRLDDLLADPLVHLVMRRDGISLPPCG